MAGRDIVTNLIANDKASKPIKSMGDAADKAADQVDDLSAAELRASLEAERAAVRVEKAMRTQKNAIERYGEGSLKAREATLRLKAAQLDLAEASEKTKRRVNEVGDSADDAGDKLGGLHARLRSMLPSFSGLGAAVAPLARVTAGLSALGLVVGGAGTAAVTLGPKIVALTGHLVQLGASVAPAAASLPGLVAGLVFLKRTIASTGPAMATALSPVTDAFVKGQTEIDRLATRHLPELGRQFVRVNFPAIHSAMEEIATTTNGIVVAVGKWVNSAHGQEAIRTIVTGVSDAFAELRPELTGVLISFGELVRRNGYQAFDLLATAVQRAAVHLKAFLDGISKGDIDTAWTKVDGFVGALGKIPTALGNTYSWLKQGVAWWKAHQDAIDRVRETLAVLAIAVGVLTGGWGLVLGGVLALITTHWTKVRNAVAETVDWFKRATAEGGSLRPVIDGLRQAAADLSSWFSSKLMPALRTAGQDLMPTLRQAMADVGKAFRDNRDIFEKARVILNAIGVVLTEWTIPALTYVAKNSIPIVVGAFTALLWTLNNVVLPGIRIFMRTAVLLIGNLIDSAAQMLGWVPGIGPKLRDAAAKFHVFKDQVNNALSGIKDQHVTVGAEIHYTSGKSTASAGKKVGYMAAGGLVSGPGGPRDDRVPAMLSNREFVVNARDTAEHRPLLESINSGRLRGYAGGGLVLSTQTGGLDTTMAAERKALLVAAKAMAPSLTAGGGAGVQQWAPLVLRALSMLGQSSAALGPVLSRMQRESGGNPRAINLTDINAQRGDPSRGLMQTIGSTFNAYAGPFRGSGIYDPMANIYAGLNYAIHRYGGGWVRRMGMPGGYDQGGVARGVGLMPKLTPAPERVLSPRETAHFERGMRGMANGGSTVYEIHLHAPNYVGDRRELVQALVKEQQSGGLDVITRRLAEDVASRVRR